MTEQPDLDFETEAHARSSDPDTSKDAAASIRMTDMDNRVYTVIKAAGLYGATSYEIATQFGLARDSVSPRIRPLRDKGLVIDSGVKRAGPTNRSQIVWTTGDRK